MRTSLLNLGVEPAPNGDNLAGNAMLQSGRTRSARQGGNSEAGDTLIEVLIAAVLLGMIVLATLTGLDSNNRATSLDRARAQADALAQQDEEQLRSEPIAKLSEVNRARTVTQGGTVYTITTTSQYVADSTSTASCNSASPSADYVRTTSTVTWKSLGPGKPVVETSLISPPPDTALIVQVANSGEAVAGASVHVAGPSNVTTETSSNGCAILAVLPGSYTINVSKTGYVDQNGYANTEEDSADIRSAYLVAETSTKAAYLLAPASKLATKFTGAAPAEGDAFVAFNSGMTAFKPFGTVGKYATSVTSATPLYPFKSKYTVYAGTCEADLPTNNGIASNPEVELTAGATTPVTVKVAPINIKVMTGISALKPGTPVNGAAGVTKDTGCSNAARPFTTESNGNMVKPGLPFGTFSICVGTGGASGKRWEGTVANNTTTGPSSTSWSNGKTAGGVATIYLGTEFTPAPSGTSTGATCP